MELEAEKVLSVGDMQLLTPIFFPSVSSVKTALSVSDYIAVLTRLTQLNPHFLVSAFDLAALPSDCESIRELAKSIESGAVVLLDSGNYESYWTNQQSSWTQTRFHEVLRGAPSSIVFSFDNQWPPDDQDEHIASLVQSLRDDQSVASKRVVVPIVHGKASNLPVLCRRVVELTNVSYIAVAERRLGDGLVERAQTVRKIRDSLQQTGRRIGLHILGTGNPTSIAIFAGMGADSFDGLEWCQTVVDKRTGLLSHLSHADCFVNRTDGEVETMSLQALTLSHNLEFYAQWMNDLRQALTGSGIVHFCEHRLPSEVFERCRRELELVRR